MRDLAGMREDLKQALEYLSVVEKQIEANHRDLNLWEATTSAALISYARCFSEGVRDRLSHDVVAGAPDEVGKFHEYAITLRNKHIAHSVNAYEDNRLVVEISLQRGVPDRVEDAQVECRRLIGVSDSDVLEFRKTCEWVLNYVSSEYEAERQRLLLALRSASLAPLVAHRMEPSYEFMRPGAHARGRKRE